MGSVCDSTQVGAGDLPVTDPGSDQAIHSGQETLGGALTKTKGQWASGATACYSSIDRCKTACKSDQTKLTACKGKKAEADKMAAQGNADGDGAKKAESGAAGTGTGGMPPMPQQPKEDTAAATPATPPTSPTPMTPPVADGKIDCNNTVVAATHPCCPSSCDSSGKMASESSSSAAGMESGGGAGTANSNISSGGGESTPFAGNDEKKDKTEVTNKGVPAGTGGVGSPASSGGGAGAPASTAIGANGERLNVADILNGERGGGGSSAGGGGGGFSGYGGGGDSLSSYLPGGKKDPTRKLASLASTAANAHPDISSMHENIFNLVSKRFQILCKLKELKDCTVP